MIEDFTDYDEVKEGDCMTTGIIDYNLITADKIDSSVLMDGSKIACSTINHYDLADDRIELYLTDRNGKEWEIQEMEDGDPIFVAREEE